MQGTTLSFSNIHNHGDLFANILKARRSAPVSKALDLPQPQSTDYDQYDTPQSRWVAVQDDDGNVLGSLRLTPTTAQSGIYSYMIRDAQNGLLDDLPTDLIDGDAPVSQSVWEVSRASISAKLSFHDRQSVRGGLIQQLLETSKEENIGQMLALLPSNWRKWADGGLISVREAGSMFSLNGLKQQAVWIDCSQPTP